MHIMCFIRNWSNQKNQNFAGFRLSIMMKNALIGQKAECDDTGLLTLMRKLFKGYTVKR